jgi:hypothetical protein
MPNSGGVPGFGGYTGAGGEPVLTPPCLSRFLFECPIDGACTVTSDADGGAITGFSYASGTRATYVSIGSCTMGDTRMAVTKADGSACYTLDISWSDPLCASARYTWTDPNGQVIAIGGSGSSSWVTCADGTNYPLVCDPRRNCAFRLLAGVGCGDGAGP